MSEASITLKDAGETVALFGARDQYLRQIREALPIRVTARNGQIALEGDSEVVSRATQVFGQLRRLIHDNGAITTADVHTVLEATRPGAEPGKPDAEILHSKRRVRP